MLSDTDWTREDDIRLQTLTKNKTKIINWAPIAKDMSQNGRLRTQEECKERWKQIRNANPTIKWGITESIKLLDKFMISKNRWSRLCTYFPDMDELTIRNKFFAVIKKSLRQMAKAISIGRTSGFIGQIRPKVFMLYMMDLDLEHKYYQLIRKYAMDSYERLRKQIDNDEISNIRQIISDLIEKNNQYTNSNKFKHQTDFETDSKRIEGKSEQPIILNNIQKISNFDSKLEMKPNLEWLNNDLKKIDKNLKIVYEKESSNSIADKEDLAEALNKIENFSKKANNFIDKKNNPTDYLLLGKSVNWLTSIFYKPEPATVNPPVESSKKTCLNNNQYCNTDKNPRIDLVNFVRNRILNYQSKNREDLSKLLKSANSVEELDTKNNQKQNINLGDNCEKINTDECQSSNNKKLTIKKSYQVNEDQQ